MFYALAAVLCCAVLFIVLAGSSLLSAGMLWVSSRRLARLTPHTAANLIFFIRILPLLLTILVTLGFALPSFLEFEPPTTHEMMGLRLLLLAACGGLAVVGLSIRSWQVIRATHRAQKLWLSHSQRMQQPEGVHVPVYSADDACPLLAVTGIFRPQIFMAGAITRHLFPSELSAAIAHELAHVSSLDNLKQMILKITQPPQWLNPFRKSDAAWINASEIAADEGALASGASALDLSSALIKVGRLGRQLPMSSAVASHLLPDMAESSIALRVMHLEKLLQGESDLALGRNEHSRKYWPIFFSLALVLTYAACVNAILPWMHEALELLVR